MRFVAKSLNVPESRVYAVATYYRALSLVPQGKHIIKVCNGTACHIRGAPNLLKTFEKELGIKNGETTEDNLFTLQTVNCLGACALAPVVTIDDHVFGKVSIKKVQELIEEVQNSETNQS
jgi:NADH-quinone oxidoreductase subunit E